MAGAIYSTSTLLSVIETQRNIVPFWLNFFPSSINFETEDIFWDKVSKDNRYLAPLVVPNVQGRAMSMSGYSGVSFKPAYVKPKHAVDPNMVITRRPGETLGSGSLSLQQRRDAVIAELLNTQRTLITNRKEWLAARAIIDGSVVLASEDYPSTTVDFRRDASLSYTLVGAAKWDVGTGTPLVDIKAAKQNVNVLTGSKVVRMVFGGTAWDLFNARVDVREQMNRNYGGRETNVTLMDDRYEGQEFMGVIAGLNGAGRIEAWVDTSKYKDEAGNEQFFLDQSTVVGVGDAAQGVQCFGAIKDFDALRAMEMFPKMWRENDPSVEYLMSQSAPLMVPRQPNATFKIKVA